MSIHTVRRGDTLWAIAQQNQISLQALIAANPQIKNPSLIHPGQRVTVPDHRDDSAAPQAPSTTTPGGSGVGPDAPDGDSASTYKVVSGDTMSGIAARHGVSLAELIASNPQIRNPSLIFPGQVLLIPRRGTAPVPSSPGGNGSGAHLDAFPIGGGRFNIGWDRNWSNFNPNTNTANSDFYTGGTSSHPSGHLGIDIFGPRGAPIVAPVSGVVVSVHQSDSGAGGRTVTIRRGNHYFYLAHLDSIDADLRVGDSIRAGEVVGTMGNSGNARGTAPHLHFSIFKDGSYQNTINPYQYLMEALGRA